MSDEFYIDGEEKLDKPFVYKACGLNGIVLLNGVERVETDYGEGVRISNLDGLHRAIGLHIVSHRKALKPEEFRFLRKEMKLTQNQLGEAVNVSGQTIARYEKGETDAGPADPLIRIVYVLSLLPKEMQLDVIAELREAMQDDDDPNEEMAVFQAFEGGWKEVDSNGSTPAS